MPRRSGVGTQRRSSSGFGGNSYRGYSSSRSPPRQHAYDFSRRGQATSTPYQTYRQPTQGMGLGSMLATGMAFGAGSAVAHNAIRGVMGGNTNLPQSYQQESEMKSISQGQENQQANTNENNKWVEEQAKKEIPCFDYNLKFVDCLKMNENDIGKCQNFFDDIKQCQKNII
jgi:hypothetical protein